MTTEQPDQPEPEPEEAPPCPACHKRPVLVGYTGLCGQCEVPEPALEPEPEPEKPSEMIEKAVAVMRGAGAKVGAVVAKEAEVVLDKYGDRASRGLKGLLDGLAGDDKKSGDK